MAEAFAWTQRLIWATPFERPDQASNEGTRCLTAGEREMDSRRGARGRVREALSLGITSILAQAAAYEDEEAE